MGEGAQNERSAAESPQRGNAGSGSFTYLIFECSTSLSCGRRTEGKSRERYPSSSTWYLSGSFRRTYPTSEQILVAATIKGLSMYVQFRKENIYWIFACRSLGLFGSRGGKS
jgi:hypothetical protein